MFYVARMKKMEVFQNVDSKDTRMFFSILVPKAPTLGDATPLGLHMRLSYIAWKSNIPEMFQDIFS